MIGGVQPKLLVSIDENGELHLNPQQAELLGLVENEYNWKLVRERDGLTKQSKEILWLEFNDEGRFKAKHNEPSIGRSLIMSPFNNYFTWQTTVITELIEVRNDYVRFKTENSTYELFKL